MPVIGNIAGHAITRSIANDVYYANSVQLDANTEGIVTGLTIKRVRWAGNVSIARGSNTILNLSSAGEWFLDGFDLEENYTASVVITIASNGTCILELEKIYT